ncbi:MAG: hypothetical protein JOY79_03670 [Acidobacteriaceae bacterium]|nr:hypothetical protein [Acidobacteriaceae bacterium]
MSKKTHGPKNQFWLVLAALNALAMSYPISVYRGTEGGDAQLLAALLLVGILFVLAVADTVTIVFAYLI